MLAIKIHNKKDDREGTFNKTIKTITNYISEKLAFKKARVALDSDCVEIVYGNTNIPDNNDQIIAELLIKKTILINKSDLDNREELDKFLSYIKNFCDQAKEIENTEYKPFYFRDRS